MTKLVHSQKSLIEVIEEYLAVLDHIPDEILVTQQQYNRFVNTKNRFKRFEVTGEGNNTKHFYHGILIKPIKY